MLSDLSCSLKVKDGYSKVTILGKSLGVYKFNFGKLAELKKENIVGNRFITYILQSSSSYDKDRIYVGKSSNGISERPLSHQDLLDSWDVCYVVTDEGINTYFDESAALFVEDALCRELRKTGRYKVLTQQTTRDAVHDDKKVICQNFVNDVVVLLEVLGLSFERKVNFDDIKIASFQMKFDEYKNGIPCYYSNRKKGTFIAGVYLPDADRRANFIIFRGSELCQDDAWSENSKADSRDYKKFRSLTEAGCIGKGMVLEDSTITASNAISFACGCVGTSPDKRFKTLDGHTLKVELEIRGIADEANGEIEVGGTEDE